MKILVHISLNSNNRCFKTLLKKINYRSEKLFSTNAEHIEIKNKLFSQDEMSNVTPKILSLLNEKLHLKNSHPINLLYKRIREFMYKFYKNSRGNPLFSFHDGLSPVVSVKQNFDSLLVPEDHVSRQKKDNYYINKDLLLRAHTTAHQDDLLRMGFDNFVMVGDVYRRDQIDASHYPVFHQLDAVKLFDKHELFKNSKQPKNLTFASSLIRETSINQSCHSEEVVTFVKNDLQNFLTALALTTFGKGVETRWVDAYFPFTHPSWELEVNFEGNWMEILGCGIMRQQILTNSGITEKVGWAFGLGLERWAMKLYKIPDIRIFWSKDARFFSQFDTEDINSNITYKPFSNQPACICDVSFWISEEFSSNDFYDLVRNVGGDLVEKVELIDNFTNQKKNRTSHCYRITYRSWDRSLTQKEVNVLHDNISKEVSQQFKVILR